MRPSSPASALASSSAIGGSHRRSCPIPRTRPASRQRRTAFSAPALVKRQRLFAKDMLAGRDGSLDLRAMQRMRRGEHDGFHLGVGQRIRVVGRQGDALFGAERARRVEVRLDGAHHADVRRRRAEHVEHFLAPPAHADEGDSDRPAHMRLSSRLMKGGIGRRRSEAAGSRRSSPSSASSTSCADRARRDEIEERDCTCILSMLLPGSIAATSVVETALQRRFDRWNRS